MQSLPLLQDIFFNFVCLLEFILQLSYFFHGQVVLCTAYLFFRLLSSGSIICIFCCSKVFSPCIFPAVSGWIRKKSRRCRFLWDLLESFLPAGIGQDLTWRWGARAPLPLTDAPASKTSAGNGSWGPHLFTVVFCFRVLGPLSFSGNILFWTRGAPCKTIQ